MRPFAGAPRRPGRYTRTLLGAAATGTLLAGCTSSAGLRDAGPAPSVSVRAIPSPLWPSYTPLPRSGKPNDYLDATSPPVPHFTVPPGGLKHVSPAQLLAADPDLPHALRYWAQHCRKPDCRLHPPAYPDLIGGGRTVLLLNFEFNGYTTLTGYVASGDSVRSVLDYSGEKVRVGTVGRDLVVEESGDSHKTTRYRWNGEQLAPVRLDSPPPVRTP
ncbi:hypothetical protein [Streptomyces sp. NPDC015125]|uniref:hypothetical protein n=1 Tax=Streptomyces sp. NPDC015125 TaxID=3364938 RepID=UPI003700F536